MGVNQGFVPTTSVVQIPTPIYNFPVRNEVRNNNSSVNFVVNSCPINISYPEGYPEFEALVQQGKIRCQMQHLDGRAKIVNYDNTGTKIKNVTNSSKWKWCKHNNGTSDVGDYLFGGVERDMNGNQYLDKIGMIMLSNTLRPNQEQQINILPELWYGYGGVGNQGIIAGLFPLVVEKWLNLPESTLRGESSKNNFISQGKTVLKNDRKYFRFCFMYKNDNNRWVQGAFSESFYIDTKLATFIDNGAGISQTYAVGFRLRRS